MSGKQPTEPAATGPAPETMDVGRELGIPAVGQAPWGTHLCQFYDAKQDLVDTVIPYFRAGLEDNERCVWIAADPLGADEASELLSQDVDGFERRVAQGQILIMSPVHWYGDPREVDPERCIRPMLQGVRDALAQGFRGLRASGNVSWLHAGQWEPFMAYEAALERRSVNRRLLALCTYPLEVCDSAKMIDVLMRHRFALIKHGDWTLIEPSGQKRATAAVERMNQALTERTAELQATLAELRGFSRWVTDDLRAPLRSINMFGAWLAESCEGKLDDEERHMLARIRTGADRMGVLIADIQAYTAAQQEALHPRSLDLEDLARSVWAGLTEVGGARRVDLRILPLPTAYGDRALLTRVLANLLGNAIKFTARNPDPHVEVGSLTNGECVYYVRDNGIGFAPVHAERVFEPFEHLHGKGDFAGSGLGLTTVRQIVSRHGGRVWAEATPGVGATFYFTLPEPGHAATA